jgi:hypothetical protein
VTETIRLGKPKKSWLGTTKEKRPGIPRGGRLGIATQLLDFAVEVVPLELRTAQRPQRA